jgi:hypothetical protein
MIEWLGMIRIISASLDTGNSTVNGHWKVNTTFINLFWGRKTEYFKVQKLYNLWRM